MLYLALGIRSHSVTETICDLLHGRFGDVASWQIREMGYSLNFTLSNNFLLEGNVFFPKMLLKIYVLGKFKGKTKILNVHNLVCQNCAAVCQKIQLSVPYFKKTIVLYVSLKSKQKCNKLLGIRYWSCILLHTCCSLKFATNNRSRLIIIILIIVVIINILTRTALRVSKLNLTRHLPVAVLCLETYAVNLA